MGENKGHGDKAPSYPELDESGSAVSRAGQSAGNQQDIDQQPGSIEQGSQQSASQQNIGNQQGADMQQGSKQHGGQHASGGTPALDDLNADRDSRDQGSPGSGSRQMDQQSGWEGKQDQNR